MLRVICLKWGHKYGADYVLRLHAACRKHIKIPFEFVCMTDTELPPVAGIETIGMNTDNPYWWGKVGLFSIPIPDHVHQVLYLDLDVVLTADISEMIENCSGSPQLWARDDFSYSLKEPRELDPEISKLMGPIGGTINSSVMVWGPDFDGSDIIEKFEPSVMLALHGDQNWISNVLGKERIAFLPEDVVGSYKYGGHVPFPITVFHGDPKPDAVRDQWVMENWHWVA